MKRAKARKEVVRQVPEQLELKNVPPSLVGIFYKERREVKYALRQLAVNQGHNSIGRLLRAATELYLLTNRQQVESK